MTIGDTFARTLFAVGSVAALLLFAAAGASCGPAATGGPTVAPAPTVEVVAIALGGGQLGIGLRPSFTAPATAAAVVEVRDAAGKLLSSKSGTLGDFGFS